MPCNCFHLCNVCSFVKYLSAMCSAGEKKLGTPGTPGGQDLAAALQKLHAQQESHSPDLFEEREHKLQRGGEVSSGFLTPNDSILSTGTNYSGISEVSGSSSLSMGSRSYLPEKLQIVKPLEGEHVAWFLWGRTMLAYSSASSWAHIVDFLLLYSKHYWFAVVTN